ncbi:MAG: glucan biosynthesis protein [Pseudochelatococcus sp.]|uniref:glucan biosynthesis protein n=1 Tax=Pseudochelatococcus sp. TaxID=2020869 RepID=UPI003D92C15B
MISRRAFLASAAFASASLATAALARSGFAAPAEAGLGLGQPAPFSFDGLIAQARDLAAQPYAPPPARDGAILDALDYEAHGKIRFDTDAALFADGGRSGKGRFPVTFFHLGTFFRTPVHMFVVEDGAAREVLYDPAYFDMPADSPARKLPADAGFAGFRFQESRRDGDTPDWRRNDWVAFLGASYFRAIGQSFQYGLSARGIALDVAVAGQAEEFPAFTRFYFETPRDDSPTVTVFALLEGPSIAGAYRFDMTRETAGPEAGVAMTIDKALFLRRDVARLGIAPLTSMYWYSETAKKTAIDWRPEVHDSDGLALWTGAGERIWRPLNNPAATTASAFADDSPRGFGLLQRDRLFGHYEDGVHYERRPSAWVEPLEEWGRGAVQLVEIPTDDEIHDNIVAFWVPERPARAGDALRFRYRLHWRDADPYPFPLAHVVATRLGNGGQPGLPRPQGVRKFVVEFLGGPLGDLPFGVKPDAVLWASRGSFSYIFTEAVPNDVPGHWRAQFDLTVEGAEPVELRLFLRAGERTLSETWAFQYHPF